MWTSGLTTSIEETFVPWLKQTVNTMSPLLEPSSQEHKSYLWTDLPPPLYSLRPSRDHHDLIEDIGGLDLNEGRNGQAVPSRVEDGEDTFNHHPNGRLNGNGNGDAPPSSWTVPKDWTWARLSRNHRTTGEGWWQDVREIELEFEDQDT